MSGEIRRRRLLAALGALPWMRLAYAGADAAPEAGRFVFVILRGGLDGLYAVPAPGDPAFAAARGFLAEYPTPPLPLDATFALHPALPRLHARYQAGELAVLHAAGQAGYRDRSHFDAQQLLESGGTRAHEFDTGWLGRALGPDGRSAIALNAAVPLLLRGASAVDTWTPSTRADPAPDLLARLQALYRDDPALGQALARAAALRGGALERIAMPPAESAPGRFVAMARRAGEFLAAPRGPQAAVLEIGGWDSHANLAAENGAVTRGLDTLDRALAALRDALHAPPHDPWARTVVVVATEFGREVAPNGTRGTDHGNGGAAFVLGGAVRGARVCADWPGVAPAQRYEGRDLRTTTDLRAVIAGLLGSHMSVPRARLLREVFPGLAAPVDFGLLRA